VSLISSFTYMDARTVKDTTIATDIFGRYYTMLDTGCRIFALSGQRLGEVGRYGIRATERLSLGFGVNVVGNREGDYISTFQLPYVRLDAMAAYSWLAWGKKVTAQLNLKNSPTRGISSRPTSHKRQPALLDLSRRAFHGFRNDQGELLKGKRGKSDTSQRREVGRQ